MTRRRAAVAPVSVWTVLYRVPCGPRCTGCGPNADCTWIARFSGAGAARDFARRSDPDARVSEEVVSRDLARRWGLA